MVAETSEGEEVSEYSDGRYNVFEPEGEPSGLRGEHGEGRRGVRVPLTYPPLTRDELDGTILFAGGCLG